MSRSFKTDADCRSLKPEAGEQRAEITDAKVSGLTLRATRTDAGSPITKTWMVRYCPKGGKQRRAVIGQYIVLDGEQRAMSLDKARSRALEISLAARQARDLLADEAEALKAQSAQARTVSDLVADFIAKHCPKLRRGVAVARTLNRHVVPVMGSRRVVDIRRGDLADLLNRLEEGGLKAQVNQVRAHVIAMFNWEIDRGGLEANPVAAVKRRKGLNVTGQRVLADAELRALWQAVDTMDEPHRAFFKLLTLLGQRCGEVRCMPSKERLPGTNDWLLPAARNKGKRDHLIPLSTQAAEIMDSLPQASPFVLSFDGASVYHGHQRLLINLKKITGIADWSWHDLRRTMATRMPKLGIPSDHIERVLNHAKEKLEGTYNTYDYEEEKRAALQKWGDRVMQIVAPNVIQLRAS